MNIKKLKYCSLRVVILTILTMFVIKTLYANQTNSNFSTTSNNIYSVKNLDGVKIIKLSSKIEDNEIKYLFESIKKDILEKNNIYVLDLSNLSKNQSTAEMLISKYFGVYFNRIPFIAINKYDDSLMYIPLDVIKNNEYWRVYESIRQLQQINQNKFFNSYEDNPSLPNQSFFIGIEEKVIPSSYCEFPLSIHNFSSSVVSLCNNPKIQLVYRVTLARSLSSPYIATPDVKTARITIDQAVHGAGISLNDNIWHESIAPRYYVAEGWSLDYTTSAISQRYNFDVSSDSAKAIVLKKIPTTNKNYNYEHTETSSFTYGIAGEGKIAKEPSLGVSASASFTKANTLVFHKSDYAINVGHSNISGRNGVSFSWDREQHPTADSLITGNRTGAVWDFWYPINDGRINSIAYRGFVPQFDVVFYAKRDAHGYSKFLIRNSVSIRPIYSSIYAHLLWNRAQGIEAERTWKNYNADIDFTVNWNSAVFTGARPVNIQFRTENNKCLSFSQEGKLSVACDLQSYDESFFYDSHNRY